MEPSNWGLWIHAVEIVVVVVLVPILRSLIGLTINLRDSTRDLTKATAFLVTRVENHEQRIQGLEQSRAQHHGVQEGRR